jgi:hypothetical protein
VSTYPRFRGKCNESCIQLSTVRVTKGRTFPPSQPEFIVDGQLDFFYAIIDDTYELTDTCGISGDRSQCRDAPDRRTTDNKPRHMRERLMQQGVSRIILGYVKSTGDTIFSISPEVNFTDSAHSIRITAHAPICSPQKSTPSHTRTRFFAE